MFPVVMLPVGPASPATAPECPLCGSSSIGGEPERISYRAIWAALAEDWQALPSADVVARNTAGEETLLRECAACGLRYFVPALAGDASFYEALAASPRYYSAWKWEFGWVCARLPAGAAVLDVGCGSGDFLAAAARRGCRPTGFERNAVAAAAARMRGLTVAEGPLEEFARGHRQAFDAVCLFHVLEHLESPRPFLEELLHCLRPGGSLFVSLPDRDRTFRRPFEPLDCPPHHLTRWSSRQIEWLARSLGLRLDELSSEPVDAMQWRGEALRRLSSRFENLPAAGPALGRWSGRISSRTLLHPGLCRLWGRIGVFERLGMRGMALAAHCTLRERAA
jgi:SAM-dependent methyltransferase